MDVRKNWLFICGGIGFAFLVLAWWLSAGVEAEELRNENQKTKSEIEGLIERLRARKELLSEQKFLKENAPNIMSSIGFEVAFPPKPKDIGVEIFIKDELQKRKRALEKKVKKEALKRAGLKFPSEWDIEAKIKNRMTESEVEEVKARILATDYLLNKAFEAGVVRARSVVQNPRMEEPLPRLERMVVRFPLTVRMSTKQEELIALLFAVSLKKKFLQILALDVEPDIHTEGLLDVNLMVAVVRMEKLREMEEVEREKRPGVRKPPRRRPRRRRY